MSKQIIKTDKAPAAIGPYSQGILTDGLLFVSGQTPLDPVSGKLVDESIEKATERCMENIKGIVTAAGASMADVVKCVVFLKDMNDFKGMNGVYASYFPENPPARSTIQVAKLPLDALVEIEAIARI